MFLPQSIGKIRQAHCDLYNLPAGKQGFGTFYYPFALFTVETDEEIEGSFGPFLSIS